jgi:hypothetical protein
MIEEDVHHCCINADDCVMLTPLLQTGAVYSNACHAPGCYLVIKHCTNLASFWLPEY